jgi:oligopeptide/dipeptide ABC transporter ATP-binding protein
MGRPISREASMSDRSGLVIDNLSVAFDHGRLEALSRVSLTVAPGEALGLVGESGSGKSLTARAILGILPDTAAARGRILFDGTSLLDLAPEAMQRLRGAGIAMIFQDPMSSLNPVLRVGDAIVQVVLSHSSASRADAHKRAIDLMVRVGIRDAAARASSYPHEFSGGMRQRIMIAMVLAASPRLLLADEPTTALDVVVQAEILRLIGDLRRSEGMGLILVSHDLAVVASMCERIAVMYAGEIVEEGATLDVLTRPRMPYTAGLLASTRRSKTEPRLPSIPGTPPELGERSKSCRFAPRCPLAIARCREGPVDLVALDRGQKARCVRTPEFAKLDPSIFAAAKEPKHV